MSLALIAGLGLVANMLVAAGRTIYVDDCFPLGGGDGSTGNPYCKLQNAICNAVAGDTIRVRPGRFQESIRMRPGVSVISEGGPAVTSIEAGTRVCVDTNFCTNMAGSTQCSAVIFGSGHTTADRLEGFTIKDGRGILQTSKVAGGGIFVFSSPTIINNVITNNLLVGPRQVYLGGGIYVGVGNPIISNNDIAGNRAVPPQGTQGNVTVGYAGGIWVGSGSAARISQNTIRGNIAGNTSFSFSIAGGGGVAVFTPVGAGAAPVIERNLIRDNTADNLGGGISVTGGPGKEGYAIITNNVIVGNAATNGGGIYSYFARTRAINNTVVGNFAFYGAGMYSGVTDPNHVVWIANNLVTSNVLRLFGVGGGIYTLDLDPNVDPLIYHNDLWGNSPLQVDGERTEASVIGVQGNLSANPLYVDPNARDFHLDPASPVLDAADGPTAPPVDFENNNRGADGNGVPDNPAPGDVDMGAYELTVPCAGPIEVSGLDVESGLPTTVNFDTQPGAFGLYYEVLSGLVSRVQATQGFHDGFCLESPLDVPSYEDTRPAPRPGDAWYYLVRAVNACGNGTLGSSLADQPGSGDVCTLDVRDGDGDGISETRDCNDANPNIAPGLPEVCDNVDNNCNAQTDEGNPGGGQSCGSDVGACEFGTTVCTSGSMQCTGGVGPATEVCDGADNNCNGQTDENFSGQPTTCGTGVCQSSGFTICSGGTVQDTCTPGTPSAEQCDGLDNDCDGVADNHLPDTDGDQLTDCVDPDDDNDQVADGSDCAPLNGTAFAAPFDIGDLTVTGSAPTSIAWANQSLGSGTRYDVAVGTLLADQGSIEFSIGTCLPESAGSPADDGLANPAPDTARYYLVRSRNACGAASYGTPQRDTHPSCP